MRVIKISERAAELQNEAHKYHSDLIERGVPIKPLASRIAWMYNKLAELQLQVEELNGDKKEGSGDNDLCFDTSSLMRHFQGTVWEIQSTWIGPDQALHIQPVYSHKLTTDVIAVYMEYIRDNWSKENKKLFFAIIIEPIK